MLMIVMSLAISLVLMTSPDSMSQQENSIRTQQEKKKESTYPTVLNLPSGIWVDPVALPPGENAWAVQIVSRGGYTGNGRGDMTLTSDGWLKWDGADGACSRRLSDETMQVMSKLVLAVGDSPSIENTPPGMCAHCYFTAMLVQRPGGERIVRASWDNVNQGKIPAEIINLYESLMAQRGCKPQ